jgi:hypothetical protein
MHYKPVAYYNTEGIQNNFNICLYVITVQDDFLLKDSHVHLQYVASSFPSILLFWGNVDTGTWVPCHIPISDDAINFFGVSKLFHSPDT